MRRSIPIIALVMVLFVVLPCYGGNVEERSFDWLTFMIAATTFVVALATLWLVCVTRKSIHSQILLQLSRDYASDEMLEAMRFIRKWKEENGSDWIEKFYEKRTNDINWEYDKYRRRISHHFYQIYLLKESGIIKKKFLETLVKQGKIDFLLEFKIVEKLSDETKQKFLKEVFEFFKKMQTK